MRNLMILALLLVSITGWAKNNDAIKTSRKSTTFCINGFTFRVVAERDDSPRMMLQDKLFEGDTEIPFSPPQNVPSIIFDIEPYLFTIEGTGKVQGIKVTTNNGYLFLANIAGIWYQLELGTNTSQN